MCPESEFYLVKFALNELAAAILLSDLREFCQVIFFYIILQFIIMKSSLKLFSVLLFVIVLSTTIRAQENSLTNYIGKSFEEVIKDLKSKGLSCEIDVKTRRAYCQSFKFLSEDGVLVLQRSASGKIEACSWVKGVVPVLKGQFTAQSGELDRTFNLAWDHCTKSFGYTMVSTETGGYLWKSQDIKQQVSYVLSRSSEYVEFSVFAKERRYSDATTH